MNSEDYERHLLAKEERRRKNESNQPTLREFSAI